MNKELLKIIFQSCVPGILCFIFMTVFISLDKTFKPHVLRKFFLTVLTNLLLLSTDAFDYYFQFADIFHQHWALLAAFGYTYRVATIGFLASIANRNSLRFHKSIYAVMILNCLLSFASIKFGFYFRFDDFNEWHAGPLFILTYVFIAYYEFLIFYSVVKNFRSNITEAIMIIIFTVACIAANILEIFEIQKLALSQTLLTVTVFYYVCLNVQLYRLDALTSLMNRNCLSSDLKRLSKYKLIIISMNINDLGKINTEKGYQEGDKAISTCSAMMSDAFRPHAILYRASGDEFFAIYRERTLDLATNSISRLQKKMMRTKYRIAVGFTEYFPGNDLEEIIAVAGAKMKENKQFIKDHEKKAHSDLNAE